MRYRLFGFVEDRFHAGAVTEFNGVGLLLVGDLLGVGLLVESGIGDRGGAAGGEGDDEDKSEEFASERFHGI